MPDQHLLNLTAQIVSAHVAKNEVAMPETAELIRSIYAALAGLVTPKDAPPAPMPEPAVPIKKSVLSDYIICLEDGKRLKTLKRHLSSAFGLTPEAYRKRWGLPDDYPMVAPAYANHRSTLAKAAGLGRKPGQLETPLIQRIPEGVSSKKKGTPRRSK